jgi:hypothetical protein
MPSAHTLFIGQIPPSGKETPPSGKWTAGPQVSQPQIYDVDAAHPLMQWLDLGDVLLYNGRALTPPPGGKVLVDSDVGPMMAIAPRDIYEDVVLGFSILEDQTLEGGKTQQIFGTSWFARPSFPVFFRNLFEYFGRQRGGGKTDPLPPGQPVTLDAPRAGAALQIRTPSGKKFDLKANASGKLPFTETKELGFYEVRSGSKILQRFAVDLFDPQESNIRPNLSPSIKVGDVEVKGVTSWQPDRKEIWKYLVLAGLVVLGIEWYIYNRRIY